MATAVSSRDDVVAVGPILTNDPVATPVYDDSFIMAAVISPSSPYFKGGAPDMNGFTFAIAFVVIDKGNPAPPRIFFAESVWGQMLVEGGITDYTSATSQFVTFRLESYSLGNSTQQETNYNDYINTFRYPVFKDMSGTDPFVPNIGGLYLAWDKSNNLAIGNPAIEAEPYKQVTTIDFNTVTNNPVTAVPGIRTLQAGMRYQLDVQNASSNRNIRVLPTTSLVPISASSTFQGLPYRSVPITNTGIVNIPIDQVDIVFLPTKWYNQNCKASTIVGDTLNFGFYHFCDRWGKLKGKETPFYANSCAPQLNNIRGNTNSAECTLTNNILYYPATTGNTCGSKWRVGVEFQNMVDDLVTATTSMGSCGDGVCGYNASTLDFVCYEPTDGNGNTCTPDCSGCNKSGCADCGTDRCTNFTPGTDQCNTDCKPQMACSNCSVPNKVPIWVWIVIVALLIIVLILFVIWQNRNSKLEKNEDEFDLAGEDSTLSEDPEIPV